MAKTVIDKRKLHMACQLKVAERVKDFSWDQQLAMDFFPSPFSIQLNDGRQFTTPVSLIDFEELKHKSTNAPCGSGKNSTFNPTLMKFNQVEVDKGFLCPSSPQHGEILLSTIVDQFNLPSELAKNLEVKLDKLVLYEIGSHYKRSYRSINQQVLGKIILQVPVESGYDGGKLFVKYCGKQSSYSNNENSHNAFYMSVVFDSCEHWMEPITRGASVCLVYNLLWTNPEEDVPRDLPLLITAVNEVKEALDCWNIKDSESPSSDETIINSGIEGSQSSSLSNLPFFNRSSESPFKKEPEEADSQAFIEAVETGLTLSPVAIPEEDDFLYFILQESYNECLTFDKLTKQDRVMATVLRNCQFLEVSLAVVRHQVTEFQLTGSSESIELHNQPSRYFQILDNHDSKMEETFQIERWIDSSNKQFHLSLELDWTKHHSSSGKNMLDQNRFDSLMRVKSKFKLNGDSWLVTKESTSLRPILVVWPKHRTFSLYCHYGLNSLLDRMESSFFRAKCKEEIIPEMLLGLKEIITTLDKRIQEDTESVHAASMTRILRFCTSLGAREEGLLALKVLGQYSGSTFAVSKEFSKEMGQAIADFEYQVAGWEDCADVISQMICKEDMTLPKMNHFVKLAHCLLDVDCTEGAEFVVDLISSQTELMQTPDYFHPIGSDWIESYHLTSLLDYLNLIVVFGDCSISRQRRFTSFVDLFSALLPKVKYELIMELGRGSHRHRYQELATWNDFLDSLYSNVLGSEILDILDDVSRDILIRILKLFLQRGNQRWLQSFLSAMGKDIYSNEIDSNALQANSMQLISTIFECQFLWDLASSTSHVEFFVVSLLDLVYPLIKVDQFSSVPKKASSEEAEHFLFYFDQVLKMEAIPSLVDSKHVDMLISKFHNMTLNQLTELLVCREPKLPSNSLVLRKLSKLVFLRLQERGSIPTIEIVLVLLRYFQKTIDSDATTELVQFLCKKLTARVPSGLDRSIDFLDILVKRHDWRYTELTNRLKITDKCLELIEPYVEGQMEKSDSTNDYFDALFYLQIGIGRCFRLFSFIGRNGSVRQIPSTFLNILAKFTLDSKMELVVNFDIKDTQCSITSSNRDSWPVFLGWYRDLCVLCLRDNPLYIYITRPNSIVIQNLIQCLMWLNDEELWQNFSSSICQSPHFDENVEALHISLSKSGTLKNVANNPLAVEAFDKIEACASDQLSIGEPPFSWKQPSASLKKFPEVEAFLRSEIESYLRTNFNGIEEARQFASVIELHQAMNGYSVTTETSGNGRSAQCVIKKNRSYHDRVKKQFLARRTKLNRMISLQQQLKKRRRPVSPSIGYQTVISETALKSLKVLTNDVADEGPSPPPPSKMAKLDSCQPGRSSPYSSTK